MFDKTVGVSLEDVLFLIEEKIESGGEVTFSPKGISMMPLIKPGRDIVTLVKNDKELKKGDILFYRRDNGKFILHRLIRFKNDKLVMCGDNQGFLEFGIERRNIIAVVKKVTRKGKDVNFDSFLYKLYVKMLVLKRFKINMFSLRYPKAVLRRIRRLIKK